MRPQNVFHDRELQFTGHSRIYSRCIKTITSNVSAINFNGKRQFFVYLEAEGSKKYSFSVGQTFRTTALQLCAKDIKLVGFNAGDLQHCVSMRLLRLSYRRIIACTLQKLL